MPITEDLQAILMFSIGAGLVAFAAGLFILETKIRRLQADRFARAQRDPCPHCGERDWAPLVGQENSALVCHACWRTYPHQAMIPRRALPAFLGRG